jgi:hypothetical protein
MKYDILRAGKGHEVRIDSGNGRSIVVSSTCVMVYRLAAGIRPSVWDYVVCFIRGNKIAKPPFLKRVMGTAQREAISF